ncbi:hypothetical protein [Modestobacter sp. VKM Ac-2978]|uniref:hypothetical protein n=1 Tax=Modestobacter sp. VKM Ac-2978 TaxID=3004132 RepID=UPI0022AADC44|nr:hypothetical protein [Modestobacter sp. VKM Ac-2978]MCZ2847460.1 hypothetical protein [Modestobacter sp. VKM Ac-2978]
MAADMSSGTGAGLVAFLNWTIERSELPRATASAMRTASTKVLSVEDGWEDLDLRSVDTDELIRRFNIRSASDYSEQSLAVYGQRFLKSVQMYLSKLDGGDWRPRNGRTPSASRTGTTRNGTRKRSSAVSETPDPTPETPSPSEQPPTQAAPPLQSTAEADGLIEYPFPVRPGLRAKLRLPEDLTPAEADRVAAFIKTLAFDVPTD